MIRTNPEIFRRNMESLNKRYPELAQRVTATKIINYQLFQAEGCIPNVQHISTNTTWYVGVLSEYFDKQWKNLKFDNVKYPVFLGFGLGYEVQYFLSKYGQQMLVQGCIIIERDIEMFVCAMNVNDLTQLIEKPEIHFCIGSPPQDIYISGREFFRANMRDMLFCGTMSPVFIESAMNIDKNYYIMAFGKFLEAVWDSLMNYGNCVEDSLIGLENMLDNIQEIATNPGINLLYNTFLGKPAIIVATGPSLLKNMHLLKNITDKALILSVDASFKLLLENSINPHLVTSLEREHEVEQFFDKIEPEKCKDIYMTACPVIYNHVYKAYNGPKIIVYRMFDHFKWLGIDKGLLDIKLSSSNMAFTIAKMMGCDPIILVGNDLAYGDDNATHATQVPFSSAGENEFEIPGNLQDTVRTNDGWFGFLKAYELDISQYKGTVINCTEGGAFIKGTQVATLQEIIDKYMQEDIEPIATIKQGLKTFDFSKIKYDIAHLDTLYERTEKDLLEIIKLCNEGMSQPEDMEISEQLKNRNIIMNDYRETFQKFLMHVVQSVHLMYEMQYAIKSKVPYEWYYYIGNITKICLESLQNSNNKLKKLQIGETDGCISE